MLEKFIGIIGSSFIGTDPFDGKSWSGSSKRFFETCKKYNILKAAYGFDVNKTQRTFLYLKNFSFSKKIWRQKFRLDIEYYKFLTKNIMSELKKIDLNIPTLQIGGIYNLATEKKGAGRSFSYHDGNLVQFSKSPYFPKGVPDSILKKAINYEKNVYDDLDIIFTMSQYLKRSFIEDFEIDGSKIHCIGAGINIDKVPKKINKDYEKKNILFI